jgi:hypothetical protein
MGLSAWRSTANPFPSAPRPLTCQCACRPFQEAARGTLGPLACKDDAGEFERRVVSDRGCLAPPSGIIVGGRSTDQELSRGRIDA